MGKAVSGKPKIEDILKKIIANIHNEFFWSSAADGNSDSLFYTESIEKITGYNQIEVKSFPERLMALIHTEDLPEVKRELKDFNNDLSKRNLKLIYRIFHKEKKIIWVSESISAERDDNGKVTNYYGIVSDITELKEAEEKIKKSEQELKSLNSSKDKFISILSHDLRAPFTSILGFAEILLNDLSISEADRNEYLRYIHASSQSQLQLINYLLDWSKLQTGKIKIERKRLSLQEIIYNCVFNLTGNAVRKNIQIKVNVPASISLKADEKLITKAITSLLSNAIKFSTENKIVEISAAVFNDDFVEVIVKDEGIGIPEKNKNKLFSIEKMFTTEGTKGEKGTGLGLALAKEIINKHNGNFWFYSEPREGTEFHFTVPYLKDTVLLVINDQAQKNIIEQILRDELFNYEIIAAKDGFDALTIILNNLPSIIITNIDIPLMNEIQFIEMIRNTENAHSIPIIIIADDEQIDRKEIHDSKGIYEIFHPFDKNIFITKLHSALQIKK